VTNLSWQVSEEEGVDPLIAQVHAGLELKDNWGVHPPLSCTGCHR